MNPSVTSRLAPGLATAPRGAADDVSDAEAIERAGDTRRPIRLGAAVLIAGFGGLLTWSAFAPLDEGVSTPAQVVIDSRRKTVQHLSGGIVREVLVREGQVVKAGDPLAVLDDAATRAGWESVRQNYMAQRAAESRLLAEQAGARSIAFHPDLMAAAKDPLVAQHMSTQQQLFDSRRAALESELAAMRETVSQLEAQLAGYADMLANRRAQLGLLQSQAAGVRDLAREGYAPRNNVLQLEQQEAELQAVMADLRANGARATAAIAETRQRMAQRREEWRREGAAQLAEVRREVQAGQDRLRAAGDELGRTRIKAPVGGQVVGLALAGQGSVVTPGQKLMDLVPAGESLTIEAKIPPHLIDRVHAGLPADVRFSAFAHTPQLVVDGKVTSVSGDSITENMGAQLATYYLARVQVTPEGMKTLGDRTLQPGMTTEVLIRTGERSVLTYLLHPLTKRIAAAMKEE